MWDNEKNETGNIHSGYSSCFFFVVVLAANTYNLLLHLENPAPQWTSIIQRCTMSFKHHSNLISHILSFTFLRQPPQTPRQLGSLNTDRSKYEGEKAKRFKVTMGGITMHTKVDILAEERHKRDQRFTFADITPVSAGRLQMDRLE